MDDTVICPNIACEANKDKIFWAWDGEGPYNITYGKKYGWIDENKLPFDSFYRACHFSYSYHNEDWAWCNRFFMIRREVKYNSNKHGDKIGRRAHYSWWKRDKTGIGYIHYTPGVRMFIFCLKQFYRRRKDILSGKLWVINSIKNDIRSANRPQAEWWRKAISWWIRAFHKELLKKIGI